MQRNQSPWYMYLIRRGILAYVHTHTVEEHKLLKALVKKLLNKTEVLGRTTQSKTLPLPFGEARR